MKKFTTKQVIDILKRNGIDKNYLIETGKDFSQPEGTKVIEDGGREINDVYVDILGHDNDWSKEDNDIINSFMNVVEKMGIEVI